MREIWNGFRCETGVFEGKKFNLVYPAEGTDLGRLAVKTEYWGAFPEAAEIDLLKQGFHLCYIKNSNRWGIDEDIDRKARFIQTVTTKLGLNSKVVCIGMSCGGLIAIKLAAKYPELISCLYLDAPVLNYMSCPCGFGDAEPVDEGAGIAEILNALGMTSLSQLICYRDMPLDKIPELLKNRIPVVMVAGEKDRTVPYHENGAYLEKAYQSLNIDHAVFLKPECDHHPHGLKDNQEVIQFILSH